ncbi:MAG: ABC transporter substrate-binding protein [Candidatus Riflebacteria bacterium]|nr:ABC transporter substrate-binding protein [Candidatus Riflebacteria bacterium]
MASHRPRLALLTALAWVIAAAASSPASPPLRLGIIGALTGPKAPYGLSHLQGARLAADAINAAGGVASHPLELVEADDRGEQGEAGPLAVRLIDEDGVLALIGSVDSGITHVLSMIAVKRHVPHLTCVATDPSLTRAGSPWTFRTLADDERQAEALAGFLARRQGVKRLSLIAGSSRYGRMGARTFARRARGLGIPVDGPHLLPTDELAWPAIVTAAAATRPEAIVLWMLSREGKAAATLLRQGGYDGLLAGADGLATPDFFASGLPAVEGTVITQPYDTDTPDPRNQRFRQAFRERFGRDPDSFAAHAYDTVRLLATALARSDLTRAGIRDALAALPPMAGVTGRLAFDATGNDTRPVALARCQGGRLITVQPADSAEGSAHPTPVRPGEPDTGASGPASWRGSGVGPSVGGAPDPGAPSWRGSGVGPSVGGTE